MGGPMGLGSATNRRYNLTFSVNARNIFNDINYAPLVGNLSSPIFGQPNAIAGGPYRIVFGTTQDRIASDV